MPTISKDRWDWIISEVVNLINIEMMLENTEITTNEIELVKSVLKNNTPFEVCNNNPLEIFNNTKVEEFDNECV